MMRLFLELARRSFDRYITYRAAALAGLATNLFFGLLRAAVMVALFSQQQLVSGFSLQDAVAYTGLTQATIAYLSLFGWYDLMRSIHTGEVSSTLLKPVSFFFFWLSQDLGRATAQLVLRGLPIILFYALYFGVPYPASLGQWLALAIVVLFSGLVSFSFRFLVNLAAFWTPNAIGIGRLAYSLSWFLSGFLMPLDFFPEWFQRICYLTPFPHMVYPITQVYLGQISDSRLAEALFMQVAWAVGLYAAGQFALRTGVRRLVIQGG